MGIWKSGSGLSCQTQTNLTQMLSWLCTALLTRMIYESDMVLWLCIVIQYCSINSVCFIHIFYKPSVAPLPPRRLKHQNLMSFTELTVQAATGQFWYPNIVRLLPDPLSVTISVNNRKSSFLLCSSLTKLRSSFGNTSIVPKYICIQIYTITQIHIYKNYVNKAKGQSTLKHTIK